MNLFYDLATYRPDVYLALIHTESKIPVTYNNNEVGTAMLTTKGGLELTLNRALQCIFSAGSVKFNFVRSVVPEHEVDRGRNQVLIEVALQDNF